MNSFSFHSVVNINNLSDFRDFLELFCFAHIHPSSLICELFVAEHQRALNKEDDEIYDIRCEEHVNRTSRSGRKQVENSREIRYEWTQEHLNQVELFGTKDAEKRGIEHPSKQQHQQKRQYINASIAFRELFFCWHSKDKHSYEKRIESIFVDLSQTRMCHL